MTALAPKEVWDRLYQDKKPHGVSAKDQIARWIVEHVPLTESGTAFEIGCFPGRYLPTLGALGYELNGVDMHQGVNDMKVWLKGLNLRVGEFSQEDFFKFESHKKFDLVLSLGFVEHFENWKEVIARHTEFVAPGGLLLLEAPNFRGRFQNWFHRCFDADNLAMHHVPAMDPWQWASLLKTMGFEILYAGYFGRFHLWSAQQNLRPWKKVALKYLLRSRNILKHVLPKNSPSFSPYAGLLARKKT